MLRLINTFVSPPVIGELCPRLLHRAGVPFAPKAFTDAREPSKLEESERYRLGAELLKPRTMPEVRYKGFSLLLIKRGLDHISLKG